MSGTYWSKLNSGESGTRLRLRWRFQGRKLKTYWWRYIHHKDVSQKQSLLPTDSRRFLGSFLRAIVDPLQIHHLNPLQSFISHPKLAPTQLWNIYQQNSKSTKKLIPVNGLFHASPASCPFRKQMNMWAGEENSMIGCSTLQEDILGFLALIVKRETSRV